MTPRLGGFRAPKKAPRRHVVSEKTLKTRKARAAAGTAKNHRKVVSKSKPPERNFVKLGQKKKPLFFRLISRPAAWRGWFSRFKVGDARHVVEAAQPQKTRLPPPPTNHPTAPTTHPPPLADRDPRGCHEVNPQKGHKGGPPHVSNALATVRSLRGGRKDCRVYPPYPRPGTKSGSRTTQHAPRTTEKFGASSTSRSYKSPKLRSALLNHRAAQDDSRWTRGTRSLLFAREPFRSGEPAAAGLIHPRPLLTLVRIYSRKTRKSSCESKVRPRVKKLAKMGRRTIEQNGGHRIRRAPRREWKRSKISPSPNNRGLSIPPSNALGRQGHPWVRPKENIRPENPLALEIFRIVTVVLRSITFPATTENCKRARESVFCGT